MRHSGDGTVGPRAAADGHDWANNSDGPGPADWSIICEVTHDWGFTFT